MLDRQILAAVAQMRSTPEPESNLEQALGLIGEAASLGVDFVALPEDTVFLGPKSQRTDHAETLDGPAVGQFREAAKKHDICVLVGSIVEESGDDRGHNTSVLIDRRGEVVAHYRKIHLFDVETPSGQVLKESRAVKPGTVPSVVSLGPWCIGLSICYDLRFPEMYRALVNAGAHMFTVPSAFTAETGRDHWLPLLKARAIENLCYVVAPNQWGRHSENRRSYGRSAIYEPWGTQVACVPDGVGLGLAQLDLDLVEKRRAHFPCLDHQVIAETTPVRRFGVPEREQGER